MKVHVLKNTLVTKIDKWVLYRMVCDWKFRIFMVQLYQLVPSFSWPFNPFLVLTSQQIVLVSRISSVYTATCSSARWTIPFVDYARPQWESIQGPGCNTSQYYETSTDFSLFCPQEASGSLLLLLHGVHSCSLRLPNRHLTREEVKVGYVLPWQQIVREHSMLFMYVYTLTVIHHIQVLVGFVTFMFRCPHHIIMHDCCMKGIVWRSI